MIRNVIAQLNMVILLTVFDFYTSNRDRYFDADAPLTSIGQKIQLF